MSIKRVKLLAKDPSKDVSDISTHHFNNLEEVMEYLKELYKGVTNSYQMLQKYEHLFEKAAVTFKINRGAKPQSKDKVSKVAIIPNMKQLQHNFDIVEQFHDKIEILDSIETQINHNFRNDAGRAAAARNVVAMRKQIEKKVNTALKFLNRVAKKHEPDEVKTVIAEIVDNILEKIEGQYSGFAQYIYLSTRDDEQGHTSLVFTHYLELADFKDDSEYEYPEYYIVFTSIVDPVARITKFVTVMPKFMIPGKFKLGHSFTTSVTGIHAVGAMLELENFSTVLEKTPLPVGPTDVNMKNFAAKAFIKDITVDDQIHVAFNSKVKRANLNGIIEKVLSDLRGLFAPKIKARIKYRIEQIGRSYTAHFVLVLPDSDEMKGKRIDRNKIRLLQTRLSLDDTDVKNIIRLLNT